MKDEPTNINIEIKISTEEPSAEYPPYTGFKLWFFRFVYFAFIIDLAVVIVSPFFSAWKAFVFGGVVLCILFLFVCMSFSRIPWKYDPHSWY